MIKGFRIRIYPTEIQEEMIRKHIGACRFIWNYMLNMQIVRRNNGEKYMTNFDMSHVITDLRKQEQYGWIKELSRTSLDFVCRDLHYAYQSFFKKNNGFPHFKSKKNIKQSYQCRGSTLRFEDGKCYVERVGWIKYKTDLKFPDCDGTKYLNARISYDYKGRFFISFAAECENQAPAHTGCHIGIDLGLKEFAVVACDNGVNNQMVFHNINKSRKVRQIKRQIAHVNRSMSRKFLARFREHGDYKPSNNALRDIQKLKMLNAKLHGIRMNYLHYVSNEIIKLMPEMVTMETLCVEAMLRNKHIRRSAAGMCLSTFVKIMHYKCDMNGIEFVQVPRLYPSSKTCSACGCINRNLTLSNRTYHCPECGLSIDRDYNAAINLMRYVYLQTQVTA